MTSLLSVEFLEYNYYHNGGLACNHPLFVKVEWVDKSVR